MIAYNLPGHKIKHSKHFFLLFLCILLLQMTVSYVSLAAEVEGLYEVSVKVEEGKSEHDLIKEAFAHTLIKVSGHSEITSSQAYASLVEAAESALLQFRYDSLDKEKYFWVHFDPKIINRLLEKMNLPVWGKVRPEILIWFVQQNNEQGLSQHQSPNQLQHQLQSQYDSPEIYKTLLQQATRRGVALLFPFLDLQDQSHISSEDIWNGADNTILLASKRYHSQSIVTLKLLQDEAGIWVSQWRLFLLGTTQSWEIRDNDQQRSLVLGINKLVDRLAQQFAPLNQLNKDKELLIQINNVNSFKDYQRLDDYFHNLATLKSLSMIEMSRDKITYKVTIMSEQDLFIQEISLGDLLNPIENNGHVNDTGNETDGRYKAVILDDSANRVNTLPSKETSIDLEYWFIQ